MTNFLSRLVRQTRGELPSLRPLRSLATEPAPARKPWRSEHQSPADTQDGQAALAQPLTLGDEALCDANRQDSLSAFARERTSSRSMTPALRASPPSSTTPLPPHGEQILVVPRATPTSEVREHRSLAQRPAPTAEAGEQTLRAQRLPSVTEGSRAPDAEALTLTGALSPLAAPARQKGSSDVAPALQAALPRSQREQAEHAAPLAGQPYTAHPPRDLTSEPPAPSQPSAPADPWANASQTLASQRPTERARWSPIAPRAQLATPHADAALDPSTHAPTHLVARGAEQLRSTHERRGVTQPAAGEPPSIHVHIGRIEVHRASADKRSPERTKVRSATRPGLDLAGYAQSRATGRRP